MLSPYSDVVGAAASRKRSLLIARYLYNDVTFLEVRPLLKVVHSVYVKMLHYANQANNNTKI